MACKEEMGKINSELSPVQTLIEPANAKTVVLQPAASASLYFEWAPVKVEDGGTALYQIAFDKTSGDFSNPVYVANSDNNGYQNFVNITHKQMNKIAAMMGIGPSETGTFKWTVFSTKGMESMKAAQENTIAITRLAGFDDVPIDVYVTGEGSEGGNDLSKAHKMKALGEGAFETYTQLTAGKPFYFTDGITGDHRQFFTEDGLVKLDGTTTIPTGGVYQISLDFTTGACIYTLVTRIGFYFCPTGTILFDLPYIGDGVFQAKNQTVTFQQEDWGRDQRYKFRMFVKENGGADAEKELEWGTLNQTDSPPTPSSPPSYYYLLLLTDLSQWDNKWKLMSDFDGVPATYTVYLQADQPYTHFVTK
jgi:hypothetical protein